MLAEAPRAFFDTSVLLYLISHDVAKSRKLDAYLFEGGVISVQVLNEFLNVARRKYRLDVSQVRPLLSAVQDALDLVPVTAAIHNAGLEIIERYKLSTYDAMIMAAALDSRCDIVLSEDMQDNMLIFRRLRIVDPFKRS